MGAGKIKKVIVMLASVLIIGGVFLAFSIQEAHTEEGVIDEWDPIKPSILHPQNITGWAFMVKIPNGTFLQLNISASDVVRVRIGTLTTNATGGTVFKDLLFDNLGTRFTQRVSIAGIGSNSYLEIKNEGGRPVNISGNIKKIGDIQKTSNPYLGLGTLTAFLGLVLLIYGILAKPKKRRPKRKS
ncbi:MAG: hypothetical protein ACPLRY_00615 [Candidatus Bathyarchaeales archaeon]